MGRQPQRTRRGREQLEERARNRRLAKLTREQEGQYSDVFFYQYRMAKNGEAQAAARAKLEKLRKKFRLTSMDAAILEGRLAALRAEIEYALDHVMHEQRQAAA